MTVDTEKMKAPALAATPQNFDSAQIKREGGWADCPTCGGDGAVSLGKDYCNYDGAALGVQFYGIGDEHVKAEAYYRAANPATVLELIAEVELLRWERATLSRGFGEMTASAMELSAEVERLRAEVSVINYGNPVDNCAAPAGQHDVSAGETLDQKAENALLWCYRRLKNSYGRLPFVEEAVAGLRERTAAAGAARQGGNTSENSGDQNSGKTAETRTDAAFEGGPSGAAPAAGMEKDAARYRALRHLMQSAKGSASLEVNQHLAYYEPAEPGQEVKLQWYPDTPIGFYVIEGATLDDVADKALEVVEAHNARSPSCGS